MADFAHSGKECAIPECRRPCYERDGTMHAYCGRTHARAAVARGVLASLSPPQGTGHVCELHGCSSVVHFDKETGRVHDFCSHRHADLARKRGQLPLEGTTGSAICRVQGCATSVYRDPVTGKESEYCSNKHYIIGTAERARECIREGCSRAAWVDQSTGNVLDYCGARCAGTVGLLHLVGQGKCSLPGCVGKNMIHPRTREELGYCCEDHRLRATQRWLGPNPEPFIDRTFRGGTTSASDFELSVLTNRHPEYQSLKEQFLRKWTKPEPVNGVSVVRIFKIKVPEDIRRRNEDYARDVSNVKRRFHGTSCSSVCTFFVDLRGGPCGETECNVCNICTHGFRLAENVGNTARRTNIDLRYGAGLYFSSISGKANDYACQSEKTTRDGKTVRCMFMASVAAGKMHTSLKLREDDSQCPPPGYDSIFGEVGPLGGSLNYDELVVYREEAALPSHLIVYNLHA